MFDQLRLLSASGFGIVGGFDAGMHDAGLLAPERKSRQRIVRTVNFKNADEKARWLDANARFDAWHGEKVRELALRFAKAPSHDPNDPDALARDFFRWVRDCIRYVSDPGGMEQLSSSDVIIEQGAGDCDDKSRLFVALCTCVRINARIRPCFEDPDVGERFVHVQAEVWMQSTNAWAACDFILRDLPFGEPPREGKKILQ
jgi:transglutaminase-like putative cysteine protease